MKTAPTSDAQRLGAQGLDNLVNDAVLQRLLGVKVLVAVEVKLDLHMPGRQSAPLHHTKLPPVPCAVAALLFWQQATALPAAALPPYNPQPMLLTCRRACNLNVRYMQASRQVDVDMMRTAVTVC